MAEKVFEKKSIFANGFDAAWPTDDEVSANLTQLFAAASPVDRVTVGKQSSGKRFAFVFFKGKTVSAAVELDGTVIGADAATGEDVKLKLTARDRKCRVCGQTTHKDKECKLEKTNHCHVGGFPKAWTAADVECFFSENEVVTATIDLRESDGHPFAFVSFADEASTDAALELDETRFAEGAAEVLKVSRRTKKCKTCGSVEHLINECPSRKGAKAAKAGKGRGTRGIVGAVGAGGNMSLWRRKLRNEVDEKGELIPGQPCFNCGQPGHKSKECPLPQGAPRPNDERECHDCGEKGHLGKDCPNKKKKRLEGQPERTCYTCGESGHIGKDCPKGTGGDRNCFSCGEPGHMSTQCPQARCYNCGENGHTSRDCPKEKGGVCYNCGEAGHQSKDCPTKAGRTCHACGEVGHLSKDCPTVDAPGRMPQGFGVSTQQKVALDDNAPVDDSVILAPTKVGRSAAPLTTAPQQPTRDVEANQAAEVQPTPAVAAVDDDAAEPTTAKKFKGGDSGFKEVRKPKRSREETGGGGRGNW
jgi:cellular nucleic acid-binding protein